MKAMLYISQSPARHVVVRLRLPLAFLVVGQLICSAPAAPKSNSEPVSSTRYAAAWEGGDFSWGAEVGPWHEPLSQPRLSGRPLFDAAAPLRWLLNTQIPPAALPKARVELIGGDCLPGRVVALHGESNENGLALPPHLAVVPLKSVDRPGAPAREGVRVHLRWVRRIVCQPVAARYQPATLFLRDGRQAPFRTLRIGENILRTLTDEGIVETPLSAVAELHLPAADQWEAYFEELAALSPDGAMRMVQMETDVGLVATSSLSRFRAESRDNAADPAQWLHMIQPAWSLDPLWLPHPQIRVRRYFDAARPPLARIQPTAVVQRSTFGSAWRWQVNRNVEGGPLQAGNRVFQGGFGVHARSELEFPLPWAAEAFRTAFGLDQTIGNGGCVRPSVRLVAPENKPLYDGPFVVGSANVLDTGLLSIEQSAKAPGRLALIVDAAHDGRPPGSDPFDIRDHANWLEPELLLSRRALPPLIMERAPRLIPAWREWEVATGDASGARLVSHWNAEPPDAPGYRLAAVASRSPLVLTRKIDVANRSLELVIVVRRPAESPAAMIEVQVNGQTVLRREAPLVWSPLRVSLAEHRGAAVTIMVVQSSQGQPSWVDWGSATIAIQSTGAE